MYSIPYHHIFSQVCTCKELWSLMVSIAPEQCCYISVESLGFLVVLEHLKIQCKHKIWIRKLLLQV